MGVMKKSIRTSLIFIALALLACVVVLRLRRAEPGVAIVSDASRGPWFEVHIVKPRLARPLFGIIPLAGDELRFDQTTSGAKIGKVGHDRLELSADGGWNLSIESDSEGRVGAGTHLVFPIELGDRQVILRCRPADPGIGQLHTATQSGSDDLDGSFLVEIATCENAASGKTTEWPPAPLTVRGSFTGLRRR